MIPKRGKDLGKLKSWRPIVLMSLVGKLADQVVAGTLMERKNYSMKEQSRGERREGV